MQPVLHPVFERTLNVHTQEKATSGLDNKIKEETVYEEYPEVFSWRDLYHKLCFE